MKNPSTDHLQRHTHRLIGGEVCRQSLPGGDWEPLTSDAANALLTHSDALGSALIRARALLAAVTYDSDGIMIGTVRQGGNGGLLSIDSIKAADQLRLALEAVDSPSAASTP